jgi:hypothetical protein
MAWQCHLQIQALMVKFKEDPNYQPQVYPSIDFPEGECMADALPMQ